VGVAVGGGYQQKAGGKDGKMWSFHSRLWERIADVR
jgi:hypothetical protein